MSNFNLACANINELRMKWINADFFNLHGFECLSYFFIFCYFSDILTAITIVFFFWKKAAYIYLQVNCLTWAIN